MEEDPPKDPPKQTQPNQPAAKRRRKPIGFGHPFLTNALLKLTLEYCEPDEYFSDLRLVSKRWKRCCEQIRIQGAPDDRIFVLPIGKTQYKPYVAKYVRLFTKLKLCLDPQITRNLLAVKEVITSNMTRLTEASISLPTNLKDSQGIYDQFVLSIFEKNKNTLRRVQAPNFCFYQIGLGNLEFMKFPLVRQNIQTFSSNLEHALKNMKKLQIIEIELRNHIETFSQSIHEAGWEGNCIAGDARYQEHLPFKIITGMEWLTTAQYPERAEYLELSNVPYEEPDEYGWGEYKDKFKSYPKLKGIALNSHLKSDFMDMKIPIPAKFREFWKCRILYLSQKLKIEILPREKIWKNEKLENSLKDDGNRWLIRVF